MHEDIRSIIRAVTARGGGSRRTYLFNVTGPSEPMAALVVGDWFRVTGPKRADGSASWWMGKPGGWQPRAFDGVWPSGQLIREHVLNIDFSQDFQALEVFRTSSAMFVQARVEIPDPRGPPGGVRSFWLSLIHI